MDAIIHDEEIQNADQKTLNDKIFFSNNIRMKITMKTAKLFLYYGYTMATIWMLYSHFLKEQRQCKMPAHIEEDEFINWQ